MKKKLEKIVSLLISVMLIVSSMPIGVLAEEVSQPVAATLVNDGSTIEDNFLPIEVNAEEKTEVKTEVAAPAATEPSVVVEPVLVTQNENQPLDTSASISASETLETMGDESGFTYTDDNPLLTTITKYDTTKGVNVKIPEILGGKKVIAFTKEAFSGSTIESVIINSNIESIVNEAFANCPALTTVEIPSSVNDIGADIFSGSPKATINCESKSWAEEYAKENNIPFKIISLPVISSFTSSKATGQNINTEIPMTATVTGGTAPYTYYFYYECATATPTTDVIPSTDNKATFKPTKEGIYNFYVKVTDANGKFKTKSIDDYEVLNQPIFTEQGFTANLAAPQYKGTDIELTALVTGGTGTLGYAFYYQKGSVTGTIPAKALEPNKAIFKPTEPGTYTLKVSVSDTAGNTAEKSIANYVVVDDLKIGSFTADNQSDKLEVNTKVNLTAQGAGGKSGYQYRFYYTLESSPTDEKTIQEYSATNTAIFQPTDIGKYNVYVQVKNASGGAGIPSEPIKYGVVKTPVIGDFTPAIESGKLYAGGETELTAAATGGTGTLTYAFKYKLENDKTAVEEPITSVVNNTAKFGPSTAGTYSLYVDITDTAGNTIRKTIVGYKVLEKLNVELIPDQAKPSPQNRDTKIKLTAKGTGGKPGYTYQFSYRLSSETSENAKVFRDYSTSNTAEFVSPAAAAETYTLSVKIKDANGVNIAYDEIGYEFRNNPIVTELKTNRDTETEHYVGDEIEFITPIIDGGTGGFAYEYYYKLGSAKAVKITDKDGNATNKFSPKTAGIYTFSVIVKDSAGLTSEKSISNYRVLAAVDGQVLKVDKLSPQNVGATIKLSTSGSGGKAPYTYKFYWKSVDGRSGEIQANSTSKTAELALSKIGVGTYEFSVDIMDASGIKKATKKINEYKVVNTPEVTFSASPDINKGQYVGQKINLKAEIAKGTGNGALSYKFYSKMGAANKKEILNPVVVEASPTVNASATVDFAPDTAGTYTFYVEVTDEDGNTEESIKSYKVLNTISGTLKTNVKSGETVNVGKSITLTATGTGGKTPYQYRYSYSIEGITGSHTIKDYSTSKTTDFSIPDQVGNYTFSVEIVDANDPNQLKAVTKLSEKVKVVDAPVVTLKSDLASGQLYEQKSTLLTAEVKSGTGHFDASTPLKYRFYYKQGSKEIDLANTTANATTATFSPPEAGNYTLCVDVTDLDVTTTQTITSYKVLKGFSGTLKTNVKSGSNINVGSKITLTATATGGQTPYQYQYSYSVKDKEGVEIKTGVIKDYSTAKTTDFILPDQVGVYTFMVKVVDANDPTQAKWVTATADSVTVVNAPVVTLTAELASGQLYEQKSTLLTAAVKTGTGNFDSVTPLQYRFYYKQGSQETDIPNTTANAATATFTPLAAGNYTLCVDVTDMDVTTTQTIMSYKVLIGFSGSLKTNVKSGVTVNVGKNITLTATGTGGKTPYLYEYSYSVGSGTGNVIKAYSTAKTVTYTLPEQVGVYTFSVKIVDANDSSIANPVVVKAETVTVVNAPVITLTADKASGLLYEGGSTGLTADVKLGTGTGLLSYRFYYKQGSTETDITTTGNKGTFFAPEAGTYTLCVDVKDADDVTTTQMIKSYKVLKSFDGSLKTNVKSGETVNVGKSVTLTATGTGGKTPYQYEYSYRVGDEAGTVIVPDTVIKVYSTAKTVTYTLPDKVGIYTFSVKIVDANNSSKTNPVIATTESVKVVDAPVVTLTSGKASGLLYAGESTELTAKVKDGTGTGTLTYRFYYKQGSTEVDLPNKTVNGNTATAEFKPTIAGSYTLCVDVTDKDVTTPQLIKTYKVLALVNATKITVSGNKVGNLVTMTATGTGGQIPYTYKFSYSVGGVSKDLPESGSKTAAFTPTTAGTYTMSVVITDAFKKTSNTYTLPSYEITK